MKATLEFNLPEETEEYIMAQHGAWYLWSIQDFIEWYKNRKTTDEAVLDKLFEICKDRGFSPWGEP